jgi:hypothetical protein
VLRDQNSWTKVKQNAGRFGVAQLIAYAARPHFSGAEKAWCDRVLTDSWARHQRMLQHLDHVSSLLADNGIPTISLKGPLLAQRYYSPPFLRKSSLDLDLAVTGHDLERACNVLLRAGYRQTMPMAEALARSHHVQLSHRMKPIVELHFRLSHNSLGIPVDQFFERSISADLSGGRQTLVLGPADQLLHLLLHLATSRFGTLFHLYELRKVFMAEPPGVRDEAIRMAVDHRFCGVLRMTEIAFRVRWGEAFLPPDAAVPKTWLHWLLDEKLFEAFEQWSAPGRPLTLAARLSGRWLDFQLTDAPADAFRSARLWTHTARYQFARGAWGNIKNLAYVPDNEVNNSNPVSPAVEEPVRNGFAPGRRS